MQRPVPAPTHCILDLAAHPPGPGTRNGAMPTPGVWMHSYSASKRSARNGVPVPNRAGIELSVLNQMEKMSVLTVIVLEGTDAPGPVHPRTICSVSRLGEGEHTLMLLLVVTGLWTTGRHMFQPAHDVISRGL